VTSIENTSVVEGPLETKSKYVPGADVLGVNSAVMVALFAETTVSSSQSPAGIPM